MLLAPGNTASQNYTYSTLVRVNNINKHIILLPRTIKKHMFFSLHLYFILLNTWPESLQKVLDRQPRKEEKRDQQRILKEQKN